MKIADLKQPYRRMAEYLAERNTDKDFPNKEILMDSFNWFKTDENFWHDIYFGEHPPITEEIKKHFPPDFDFSGEEYSICYAYNENDLSNDFKISYKKNYDYTMEEFYKAKKRVEEKEKHTQLAKEGKFDQLPDTCEFSEPINLHAWDNELMEPVDTYVLGKFKGLYVTEANLCWQYAKLPTKKIDFSEFKSGDVVEVELSNEEKRIGWFDYADRNQVVIKTLQRKGNQVCNGGSCSGSKMFNKEKIKSINKIK